MKLINTTAIAIVFVLGLTASASALSIRGPMGGGTPPGGGQPPCIGDCSDSTEPGEPFDPKCIIDCDTSSIPDPDKPEDPGNPDGSTSTNTGGRVMLADGCGDKLGFLRRVTEAQIQDVGSDDLVDVVVVCRSRSLVSEQEDVARLRPVIGQNAVLDHELGRKGYEPEDVVGVIVNDQQVVLYVHRS